MKLKFLLFAAALFSIAFFSGCTSTNKNAAAQLGEIHFPVHANKEAEPYFQKGLLLLHSFEYEDAAENFIKAQELDSTCVMAYWGEAMTYTHPLWQEQNYEKGNAALFKLGATQEERAAKSSDELEKDFITATGYLYGKGTKAERDSAYSEYMGMMHKKYPGDNEVTAFYSLSLLGSVQVGRDVAIYEHAAQIAKEVLSRNKNHPGGLHYLIHSYDDPDHALGALDAADKYSLVAPAAGHALHMPSHIYLALGMWNKVVSSNEASWAATVERKNKKKLIHDALGYHSLHWLQYAYLQQGRMEDAKKVLDEMKAYCDSLPSIRARTHLIFMKTTFLAESNDWNSDADSLHPDLTDINIAPRAMYYFSEGMKAYHRQDDKTLSEVIQKLNNERLSEAQKVTGTSATTCMGITRNVANLLDVQQSEVMELELRGLHAWLMNDTSGTENFFKEATTLENSISYSYGPPEIVKPSNEMYGEWLIVMNRPKEGLNQFNLALKAAPNRVLSLQGKMKSASMIEDHATSTGIDSLLKAISSRKI